MAESMALPAVARRMTPMIVPKMIKRFVRSGNASKRCARSGLRGGCGVGNLLGKLLGGGGGGCIPLSSLSSTQIDQSSYKDEIHMSK
jgi:hypothetical protein